MNFNISQIYSFMAKFVTIEQVKSFVDGLNNITGSVSVHSADNYVVSGRSLLGLFGLDLSVPVVVECVDANHNEIRELCERLNLIVEE